MTGEPVWACRRAAQGPLPNAAGHECACGLATTLKQVSSVAQRRLHGLTWANTGIGPVSPLPGTCPGGASGCWAHFWPAVSPIDPLQPDKFPTLYQKVRKNGWKTKTFGHFAQTWLYGILHFSPSTCCHTFLPYEGGVDLSIDIRLREDIRTVDSVDSPRKHGLLF